jgi:hypothetical protein
MTKKILTHDQIKRWLDRLGVKDYVIQEDGTVDVNTDVQLPAHTKKGKYKVPVKFGMIRGDFRCGQARLDDLTWLPSHIQQHFDCTMSPTRCLSGIHKVVKFIGGDVWYHRNATHILGLLMVDGCRRFGGSGGVADSIMNKYSRTGNVLAALEEMLSAGYIEEAKL